MTAPAQHARRLTLGIHGDAGTGKSVLAASGPTPRLILDAEAGAEYLPGKIIHWDPIQDSPPAKSDDWDTCVVSVREWPTVDSAYQWLNSGDHPFESLSLDSVTEIQAKCGAAITGGSGNLEGDQWQELLRAMNEKLRAFRDLKTHPTHPLWSIAYVCMTETRNNRRVPMAQGKLRDMLPYFVDAFGYMEIGYNEMAEEQRVLKLRPTPGYVAKERVGGRLGTEVVDPDLTAMLRTLNTTN
jgi:AAA domain